MANLSLTFKFICIFSIFVFICLVLYNNNNKPFVEFSFPCSAETYDEMINSRLSVDEKGEISPSDLNGNLLSLEHNRCLRVNNSAFGIKRFMHKDAFVDVNCSVVNKRLLKNNTYFKKTALASIPGSGNTWTRHLIEEMTGIYTGSVYSDQRLKPIFPGEGKTEGVIVVKTHEPWTKDSYNRAVLIVRDPFESSLALFNLLSTDSHTDIAATKQKSFLKDFEKKLKSKVDKWVKYNEEWMLSFPGPVFVLFYDKLKSDLPASLAKLAFFLGVNTTLKDLWCVNLRQEGSFHRPSKPEWMSRSNLLNDDLEKLITEARNIIFNICTEKNHTDKITSNL